VIDSKSTRADRADRVVNKNKKQEPVSWFLLINFLKRVGRDVSYLINSSAICTAFNAAPLSN
jgi:hypothetical protein